jgi:hypothetical protein
VKGVQGIEKPRRTPRGFEKIIHPDKKTNLEVEATIIRKKWHKKYVKQHQFMANST